MVTTAYAPVDTPAADTLLAWSGVAAHTCQAVGSSPEVLLMTCRVNSGVQLNSKSDASALATMLAASSLSVV